MRPFQIMSNLTYAFIILLAIVFLSRGNFLISQEKKIQAPKFLQGEVLVKFKPKTPKREILSLKRSLKVKEEHYTKSIDLYHWKGDFDTKKAIEKLKKSPHLLYAEPNYVMEINKPQK